MDIFCSSLRVRKSIVNVLKETDNLGNEHPSDEEDADRDLKLLLLASLEINGINDNQDA